MNQNQVQCPDVTSSKLKQTQLTLYILTSSFLNWFCNETKKLICACDSGTTLITLCLLIEERKKTYSKYANKLLITA